MSVGNGRGCPTCPACGQKLPQPLTAQQRRVQAVEALFERYGVEGADRPDAGHIARWLKAWDDDEALRAALIHLGDRGVLTMPLAYVAKCLGTALKRGKRPAQRAAGESDRVMAEAKRRQEGMG